MNFVEETLTNDIKELIENEEFEFVDLKYVPRGDASILRVFADSTAGITIEECKMLSGLISDFIFKYNKIEGRFTLEVSSPGIDRPLKTERDFRKNINRDVVVLYKENGAEKEVIGKIISIDDKLTLEVNGDNIVIPIDSIVKGEIKLKW
ncbi:ribosome maturation factor RimP [candidate division KSB1 bacterium]